MIQYIRNWYKVWWFQDERNYREVGEFKSEKHYIFVAVIWEEERECVNFLYIKIKKIPIRLSIFGPEDFMGILLT